MQGTAFGRSMIVDRSGTIRTDTGYRHGIAALALRPGRAEERRLPDDAEFRKPLLRSQQRRPRRVRADRRTLGRSQAFPHSRKRQARIAVAYCADEKMWVDGAYPDEIIRLLAKAAAAKPDLILFSENNIRKPE